VTIASGLKPPAARFRVRTGAANVAAFLALLMRAPRIPRGASFAWRSPAWFGLGVGITVMAVAAALLLLDGRAVPAMLGLPGWILRTFATITDFGKSGWFLVPIGAALLLLAVLACLRVPRAADIVLTAAGVRLAFLFTAIAVPSLFDTILKRIVGRARPFVGDHADPFNFMPLAWRPDYASLPSGHATTAFAALAAVGLVWPRLRWIMLAYALAIAVSRVVLLAHYPSDVIAGAALGAGGAFLVRDWFAARRLGFVLGSDGRVRALPGPSWARIKRVARQLAAP
jgi:undecaprenyl-diphosphatase